LESLLCGHWSPSLKGRLGHSKKRGECPKGRPWPLGNKKKAELTVETKEEKSLIGQFKG